VFQDIFDALSSKRGGRVGTASQLSTVTDDINAIQRVLARIKDFQSETVDSALTDEETASEVGTTYAKEWKKVSVQESGATVSSTGCPDGESPSSSKAPVGSTTGTLSGVGERRGVMRPGVQPERTAVPVCKKLK
jgi:hypothetical protein